MFLFFFNLVALRFLVFCVSSRLISGSVYGLGSGWSMVSEVFYLGLLDDFYLT